MASPSRETSDLYNVQNVSPQLSPFEDKLILLVQEMQKLLMKHSYVLNKTSLYDPNLKFADIEDVYLRLCAFLRSDPDAGKISFDMKMFSPLIVDIFTKIFDGIRVTISFDGVVQIITILQPTMSRTSILRDAYKLHKSFSKMKAGLQPISRDMYKPLRLNLRIRRWIDQIWVSRTKYERRLEENVKDDGELPKINN